MNKNNSIKFFRSQLESDFTKIKFTNKEDSILELKETIFTTLENKLTESITEYSENKNKLFFTDLFCGAGGLSIGLEQAGFYPNFALDKDKSSLLTYHFNRPYLEKEQLIMGDIRSMINDVVFPNVPLVVGGPPCQGFSNANKQRKENDDRNELYKFFVHVVEQASPDIFILENVTGILKYLDIIREDFQKVGFILYPYILNTKDFGFPQNRKRVFLLGISKKNMKIAKELNSIFDQTIKNAISHNTKFILSDAISDLPPIKAKTLRNSTFIENQEWGYTYGEIRNNVSKYAQLVNQKGNLCFPILNHKSKYNNTRDIKIYGLLNPGEGSDADSINEINPYLSRQDIFKDKFYRLMPNEPSKTITAHMYYDCHMYIHPFEARGLSPREAARVQGFPDDYLFMGTPNEWYRQIGNAVSPLIAKVIGKALHKILDRIYEF